MQSHHRDIIDFLTKAGATGIEVKQGGKHPRIEFNDFSGNHRSYTVAASPSDHRAVHNAIAGLRRMLSASASQVAMAPPPPPAVKLEDMTPAPLPGGERYTGKAAMYYNHNGSTLRFYLPKYPQFNLVGKRANFARLAPGTWQITIGDKGTSSFRKESHTETCIVTVGARPMVTGLPQTFAAIDAGYTLPNATTIVVHISLDDLKPAHTRSKKQPAIVETSHLRTDVNELRQTLATINRIEHRTMYQLVRTNDRWVWRSPDITDGEE